MGDIWRVMRVRMVTGSLRRDYIHNQTLDIIESRGSKIAKALIEASERLNKNPWEKCFGSFLYPAWGKNKAGNEEKHSTCSHETNVLVGE